MRLLADFIFIWLAVVGGCIGSFLNVVVHRLPSGKSIVYPGSRCPRCGQPIRWYHNLPVVGWLTLRGRCYDCGQAISPRYPLVEALVATTFLLLALAVFNQPDNPPPESFFHGRPWGVYGTLAGLFSTLVCALLIGYDRQPQPRAVWVAAVLFALGLGLAIWL
jgi:prepilin signal peptidase PulO-like enzyme (type II secretory pathway)